MNAIAKFDMIDWMGETKSRWILHVLFWMAVLVFYTIFFGYKTVDYKITFSFVVVLLPVTMITTYFLNYTLLPNFLFRKRYGKFFLYFTYTLIISFYIEMATVIAIFILVAELNIKELHPSNTDALILIAGMYLVVFLGVAIKLVSHYNQNQSQIQSLQKDKLEAELKFLKSQLHPHFLFNTLNNLYSLTLERSERASEVVLKLSDLLDYVLYKCEADFVPLEMEVEQLSNYIELEKLRYGERLKVDFEKSVERQDQKIPPMILMTLLENSFKHGISKAMQNSWIKMKLDCREEDLVFEISNSKEKQEKERPQVSGGIGLENLKSRLKLVFKDQFELTTKEESNAYFARLKLNKLQVR